MEYFGSNSYVYFECQESNGTTMHDTFCDRKKKGLVLVLVLVVVAVVIVLVLVLRLILLRSYTVVPGRPTGFFKTLAQQIEEGGFEQHGGSSADRVVASGPGDATLGH